MATTEYMTSQTYSATVGGVVYNVTASIGGPPDYTSDKAFGGDVTIAGDLDVTGSVAGGALTVDSVSSSGNAGVGGNLIVTGTLTVGGSSITPAVPWDGHTALSDTAYDDIVVSASMTRAPLADPAPTVAWLTSLEVPQFTAVGGKYLHFGFQLPHSYVSGTNLLWHVHFTTPGTIADGETVIFKMTFSSAAVWGVYPSVGTASATFTNNAATRLLMPAASLTGTTVKANCHLIAGGATITGTTYGASSIVYGRIERDAADTHGGDAYMISADAHIQKNRLGSENEYTG